MAISTLQVVANALKTYYLDPLISQLDNQSGPILAMIEKNADEVIGGEIKFALEYGRSGGVGARAEDGDLPAASPRKHQQASLATKNLYARLMLTKKLIEVSKSNKAAFVNQLDQQMKNLVTDANDMLRRNMMGSANGYMGQVNANTSSSTSFVLKAGSGKIDAFYPGQLIDIGTVSGTPATMTKTVTAGEIVDVDYDTATITLASSASLSANMYIVLAGNFDLELIGLGEIMTANNTLYGINRANNKWFNPIVKDHASGGTPQAFDSMWIQEAKDLIFNRTGEVIDMIACDDGIQRAYIDEQNTYKRNIEYMTVDGGYRLCSYSGVPITVEKYMPVNTVYLLTTKWLKLARLGPWDWLDDDGNILSRVKDKAAFEASLVMYAELICKKPGAFAKLTGIAEV